MRTFPPRRVPFLRASLWRRMGAVAVAAETADRAARARDRADWFAPVDPLEFLSRAQTTGEETASPSEDAPSEPQVRGDVERPAPSAPREKIALIGATSLMDRHWELNKLAAEAVAIVAPSTANPFCSGCDAHVPAWFGTDCISAKCPLRTTAIGQ